MRFLVDECCGPVIAQWLRDQGHEVRRVAEVSRGMDDAEVLQWACREQRVLLTNDKDFGARVFEKGEAHCGVILLRLTDERPVVALKVLARVLERFSGGVESRFIVASERRIRPDEADEMTKNRT